MHIPNYGMFFSIAPTKTNVCFDIFLMIHGFIQFFNMITHKNLNFHFIFFFFFLFQNNMEKEIQILTFLNNLILDQLFVFLYQRCSIFLHFFFPFGQVVESSSINSFIFLDHQSSLSMVQSVIVFRLWTSCMTLPCSWTT